MTAFEERVELDGREILVRDTGGDDSAVLMIHGIGCHTAMWAPAEQAWPALRMVSFDPLGSGRSPATLLPMSIGQLARLAERVLDHLGIERVDVLGYSLDGTIAQTLAYRAPARVRRLVLVATAPGWGAVPGQWESMIHLYNPLRYFSAAYYRRTIGVMAGGQARDDPAFVERHAVDRMQERPFLLGYYSLTAAATWSSIVWLDKIAVPTLVVVGGDDPLLPPVNSVMLARRIPHARLQVHPHDGHLLLCDEASPAIPGIGEFLQAPSLRRSSTWRAAAQVSRSDEDHAIRHTRHGLFPWGLASAAFRAVHSPSTTSEGALR